MYHVNKLLSIALRKKMYLNLDNVDIISETV